MQDFEKLGEFYLGKEYDLANRTTTDNLLLYDSRDLCTHAVVVGMTGSGKTGLCIGLLEEAGMDRIPSIVIDPKGDISNLLLTFPNLSPEDFRPWIDEGQAARKGVSPEEFATDQADTWKKGLAKWGQDGERIRKLRESVDMRVYTPGSTVGRPITILKSFSAPNEAVRNDPEALLDRVSSASSGILALLGIDADPIRSREHILISNILSRAWQDAKDLDLRDLITQIKNPPFDEIGAMQVDEFFPEKDRQSLAMTLNNLLASPSFSSWVKGEPLDIESMLYAEDPTGEGGAKKPVISIVSIAHLDEQERMFFVTILLNEVVSWMRNQAGTSSLRAILYMDEVFGYFPPVKNPPTKKPMLTLLKQARAFGLGCILATQNPVDLDYKGLSNAGTWFLGRLQTERDKMRVLEGLEGASTQAGSTFNRSEMEKTLASLGSRIFLMNSVHLDQPVVFETRWVMSYLRGPLSRQQLMKLQPDKVVTDLSADEEISGQDSVVRRATSDRTTEPADQPSTSSPPASPSETKHILLRPNIDGISGDTKFKYKAALMGTGSVHFRDKDYEIDEPRQAIFLANSIRGEDAQEIWRTALRIGQSPEIIPALPSGCSLDPLPAEFEQKNRLGQLTREFEDFLNVTESMPVWSCGDLKLYSNPNETLPQFKQRVRETFSKQFEELARELKTQKRTRWKKRFVYWFQYIFDSLFRLLQKKKTRVVKWSTADSRKLDSEIEKLKSTSQEIQQKIERIESQDESGLIEACPPLTPIKKYTTARVEICWLPWINDGTQLACKLQEGGEPTSAK